MNITINTFWHANHPDAFGRICQAMKHTPGWSLLTEDQQKEIEVPLEVIVNTLPLHDIIWCIESSRQHPKFTGDVINRLQRRFAAILIEELQSLGN